MSRTGYNPTTEAPSHTITYVPTIASFKIRIEERRKKGKKGEDKERKKKKMKREGGDREGHGRVCLNESCSRGGLSLSPSSKKKKRRKKEGEEAFFRKEPSDQYSF